MRRLSTTRRHVALDRSDEYLIAWEVVRHQVESAGGRAWIFRGAAHEDQFLEFIEWTDGATEPLEDRAVAESRTVLDTFAPASVTEEWEQAQ